MLGWGNGEAYYTAVPPTPAQAGAVYGLDGCVGPTMEQVMGASLPFVATQAFIRRGLGAGAVDRFIATEPPLRFMYENQTRGSRPSLPPPGFGPVVPDTLSPGLDNYLVSLTAVAAAGQSAAACPGRGGCVPTTPCGSNGCCGGGGVCAPVLQAQAAAAITTLEDPLVNPGALMAPATQARLARTSPWVR